MKKILKFIILIGLIVMLVSSLQTYAQGSGIVTVSSEKVTPGEQFYLILNLSSIDYNKFEVAITNTQGLVSGEPTGTVSNLASNPTVTTFSIDKESVGLDKLGVVYTAPENEGMVNYIVKITPIPDIDVNAAQTRIEELNKAINEYSSLVTDSNNQLAELTEEDENYATIKGQITDLETQINNLTAEKESLQQQLDNARNVQPITANARIEVNMQAQAPSIDMQNMVGTGKDIKEAMNKNMTMNEMELDMSKMKDKMKMMEDNEFDMKSKMSSLQVSLKDASDKITSLSQGTTYQGSNNNYLSNLVVSGYDLNNTFDKTTNDYFITVPENVTSVNVTATKEDSTATVTIYGNTNLANEQNKIIINVTAQDGSVRTYRIYVSK